MKTKSIVLALMLILCGVSAVAASPERSGKDNQSGIIIAIEGSEVFIDLNENHVKVGDNVSVYAKPKHFIHPVTKKKIMREPDVLATFKVTSVYKDYSAVEPLDSNLLIKVKVGMKVKLVPTPAKLSLDEESKAIDDNANQLHEKSKKELFKPQEIISQNRVIDDGKIAVYVAPAQVNDVVGVGYFGTYVSDLLMEQLMLCDKVRLLDRTIIGQQIEEVNLTGDYIDPQTAIKRGKIAGARYVVQVTMQKPDVVNVRTGIPLASIMGAAQAISGKSIGAQHMPNLGVGKLTASVSVTARVVDLETGEVMFMSSGTGKAKGKSQLSMEYGALGGMELNGGAEGFKQTVTGKAIQKSFITIGRNLNQFFNGNAKNRVMGSASGFGNYDEKMEKRGRNLFIGTEKLTTDDVESIFHDKSQLYFKYKSARKNVSGSWFMIVPGVISMAAGVTGCVTDPQDTFSTSWGAVGIIAGAALTTGGVIMNVKAHKNIRKIADEYNRDIVRQQSACASELNLIVPPTGGIGLQLTF